MSRRPLGLASSDLELRKLIPFESTPETERFGRLAAAGARGGGAASSAVARAVASRDAELQLPVPLAEQAVARLQEDGKLAFKQQDLARAIEAWSDALAQVRSIPAPPPKKLEATRAAQLYANRCQAYMKCGREGEALADAESACDAAPGWPKAYYRLGTVLMERGQLERAHAVLSQGLQLDQSNEDMRKVLYKVKELRLAAAPAAAGAAAADAADAEYGPAPKPGDEAEAATGDDDGAAAAADGGEAVHGPPNKPGRP